RKRTTPRDCGGLGAGTAPSVQIHNLIDGDRFLLGNQLDPELSRVRQIESATGGADGKPQAKAKSRRQGAGDKMGRTLLWPCD
ncbi:MAG: hypothetical protein WBE48_03005, partial [Xanthobacteraceae bacterium]